jgi:hypothetical protein
MLGPVDFLHLGQLGQLVERLADRLPLHGADREMHPGKRAGGDQEQQHEAAGPHAGQVVHHAEEDRQDEAAEAADQPDHAADRTDMVGVVDRDVLVDGGLAEAHEEAEHEYRRP